MPAQSTLATKKSTNASKILSVLLKLFGGGVAAVLLHWVTIMIRRLRYKLPPGPMPLPLIGNLPMMASGDPAADFEKIFKTYGQKGMYSIWMGDKLAVVHNDPEIDRELCFDRVQDTNARPKTEAERHINYDVGHCEGIHSAEGPQWKKVRSVLVSDLLKVTNLNEKVLPIQDQEGRNFVKHVMDRYNGKVIGPRMLLKVTAMNTSLQTVLGAKLNYEDLGEYIPESDSWTKYGKPQFEQTLPTASQQAFWFFRYIDQTFVCLAVQNARDVFPWPLNSLIPRPPEFQTFFEMAKERNAMWKKIINEHRATVNKEKPRDWVDMLILDQERLKISDAELVGVLMDTVIATSDTFIALIEWILAFICDRPDIQKKLQDELDRVVGQDRLVEARDQINCPYYNAFIKEILRTRPITPINPPRRAMVDTQLAGYDIPKDTWIFQHWGSMMKRPDLWKDPEVFRPERFLDESAEDGHYAFKTPTAPKKNADGQPMASKFVAFAYGQRSCPGYRLGRVSVFLQSAMMIQCFDWEPCADSDLAPHTRLITFPKKLKCNVKYRLKKPLDALLKTPCQPGGGWFD
jgi:coumaroylquinate(coumaroylshikimate) 3'-monooxygenase